MKSETARNVVSSEESNLFPRYLIFLPALFQFLEFMLPKNCGFYVSTQEREKECDKDVKLLEQK